MIKLAKRETSSKTLASTYSDYLMEAMDRDDKIMHIECDLGLSIVKFDIFQFIEKHPTRWVNVGIQEANAIGFACGASHAGMKPWVHSFGPFMSRRAADQVFMAGAYSKANVNIIGSDPGVVAMYNGGTHMPFEDTAIMRSIPEIVIVEPADNVAAKALYPQLEAHQGMTYTRLARKAVTNIYEEGSEFKLGKGNVLREGKDVTLIAAGVEVEEALIAAELLEKDGISAKVVDMFCIRPLDRELVIASARETGAIVTCENHSVNGGLGDAVTQVVMDECLVPVERVGSHEKFGQVGDMQFLKEQYGMDGASIAAAAKRVIAKK